MKVIHQDKDKFIFLLERSERRALQALLRRYPLVPSAYQPLSKFSSTLDHEANQRLLDEALDEQRQANKRQLQAWLNQAHRFEKTRAAWSMTVLCSDCEWLMQVLNDIRVGSWILLGSPEGDLSNCELNERNLPHLWAMEMAGHFEADLLRALSGSAS